MRLGVYAIIAVMLLVGCARYPEVLPNAGYGEIFDPSQCTESYTWQGHLSTRGLFERTVTCTKKDIPEEVRVKELPR